MLLPNDFTKADFPKLRADMNKWYQSMPNTAIQFWKQDLETADQDKSVQPGEELCPMSILKNGYKRPGNEGQSIEQPTVNLYFREKEAAPLEEVYNTQCEIHVCSPNFQSQY